MLGSILARLIPQAVLDWQADREFHAIPRLEFPTESLIAAGEISLDRVFRNPEADLAWQKGQEQLRLFDVRDGTTGGVNPGDRRAVFYLITHFRPQALLEVGTHVGASMVHIATALHLNNRSEGAAKMISVDIEDLNDPQQQRWLKYGVPHSPRQWADKLGVGQLVEFVTSPSLDYMASCRRKFNFIFLDGDHSQTTVYRELSAALKLLAPGGVILLHDYYPDMKPLWSNNIVLAGPVTAVNRIRSEGVNVRVLPLGELPWPTKCNSNVTSLALLTLDAG